MDFMKVVNRIMKEVREGPVVDLMPDPHEYAILDAVARKRPGRGEGCAIAPGVARKVLSTIDVSAPSHTLFQETDVILATARK